MTVREELERQEHRKLNPLAAFSDESRGRPRYEAPREDDVRTCYQRDIDRIVHCKSFRTMCAPAISVTSTGSFTVNLSGRCAHLLSA